MGHIANGSEVMSVITGEWKIATINVQRLRSPLLNRKRLYCFLVNACEAINSRSATRTYGWKKATGFFSLAVAILWGAQNFSSDTWKTQKWWLGICVCCRLLSTHSTSSSGQTSMFNVVLCYFFPNFDPLRISAVRLVAFFVKRVTLTLILQWPPCSHWVNGLAESETL